MRQILGHECPLLRPEAVDVSCAAKGPSMSEHKPNPSMGWLPDYPDYRDYTPLHEDVPNRIRAVRRDASPLRELVETLGLAEPSTSSSQGSVSLRQWCPPIEDQGPIGSCTANAGVGLIEYYERRAFGRHIDASRLFLYKATRNLLHWTGDAGAP